MSKLFQVRSSQAPRGLGTGSSIYFAPSFANTPLSSLPSFKVFLFFQASTWCWTPSHLPFLITPSFPQLPYPIPPPSISPSITSSVIFFPKLPLPGPCTTASLKRYPFASSWLLVASFLFLLHTLMVTVTSLLMGTCFLFRISLQGTYVKGGCGIKINSIAYSNQTRWIITLKKKLQTT